MCRSAGAFSHLFGDFFEGHDYRADVFFPVNGAEGEAGFGALQRAVDDVRMLELLLLGGDEADAETGAGEGDDGLRRRDFDDVFGAEPRLQAERNYIVILKRPHPPREEDKGLVL